MSDSNSGEELPRGWKTDTLGAICRSGGGSIQTGPFGSQLHADDYKSDGIPIITVEHLKEGKIAHENLPLVGKEDFRRLQRYNLATGDLVFSRVGAIDRCAYVSDSENGWLFSGRCLRVRAGLGESDSRFLSYLLNSSGQRQWILNHSVGSTMACLNTAILSGVPIAHPGLPQQRKIARILTTVDNLIEKTEALIAKYQAIKQGMMHDLFTRGVDEHGHLRPPYEEAPELYKQSELGWIPKDWECVPLGRVVPVAQYGISVSLDDSEGMPVLRMNNLENGVIDVTELKRSRHPGARRLVLKGKDVLFNRTNSIDHVGRTSIWKNELPEASFASYLVRLVPDFARLTPEFLVYWMNRPEVQIAIRQFATPGVHQVNINPTNLRKSLIAVPSPLFEQSAITQVIRQHEEQINVEQTLLAKLYKQKTGLMQDLLTGKVRVNVDEAEEIAAHV